jgi:predicted dehydrogenase
MAQRIHLKNLASLKNVEIAALCDINRKTADMVAKVYNVGSVFSDYNEMLSKGSVDAVVITTPPSEHLGPALAAAKKGKAVFVEKPVTETLKQCEDLLAEFKKSKATLMAGFMRRHDKALDWAHDQVASGKLGKLIGVSSSYRLVSAYPEYLKLTDQEIVGEFNPSAGYKANRYLFLLNNLIHHADLLSWMGGHFNRLIAFGRFEDTFALQVVVEFANGALGRLSFAGILNTEWREGLSVDGDKGTLDAKMAFPYLPAPTEAQLTSRAGGLKTAPTVAVNTMYQDEMADFVRRAQESGGLFPSQEEIVDGQRMVSAIEASLKTGTWASG